jgi:2-dehydropantoate 2-reductase
MDEIKRVHIIGMGALGLLFGTPIAEYLGEGQPVYVMDAERAARHGKENWTINGRTIHPVMQTPEAASLEGPADLILVGVKYPALSSALETMASSVGENTVILSMMNGIDSEEILGERFGREKVLHTIAQGMDAQRYGCALNYTVPGKLHIGVPKTPEEPEVYEERRKRLERVRLFFDAAKVPYVEEADILYRLWSKFMLNVGCNQACMVYDAPYGKALEHGSEAFAMTVGAMREVCLLARAKGIEIGEEEVEQYIALERTLDPKALPSMGQDRRQKHPSEVEMFAGTVMRLGKELGIEVPINEFLYRRVKEIEAEY